MTISNLENLVDVGNVVLKTKNARVYMINLRHIIIMVKEGLAYVKRFWILKCFLITLRGYLSLELDRIDTMRPVT